MPDHNVADSRHYVVDDSKNKMIRLESDDDEKEEANGESGGGDAAAQRGKTARIDSPTSPKFLRSGAFRSHEKPLVVNRNSTGGATAATTATAAGSGKFFRRKRF